MRRALIDNGVKIPDGEEIGYDLEKDRQRFTVTPQWCGCGSERDESGEQLAVALIDLPCKLSEERIVILT